MPADLAPRAPVPKRPVVVVPDDVEGQVIVKFRDDVKARPQGGEAVSLAGADLSEVDDVLNRFGLSLAPAFEQSFDLLDLVQRRAAIESGKAQPDLGGIMVLEGARRLEAAANALNQLDQVEYVEFIPKPVDHGGPISASEISRQVGAAAIGAPTPNFAPLQRHRHFFYDVNGDGILDAFGADTIIGTADDEFYGGFDLEFAFSRAQFLMDEGLVTDTWNPNRNGGRGATIRVGVVEGGADVGRPGDRHEDLRHVILEPGQVLMPHEVEERDHGSATLGIIAARDHGLDGWDRRTVGDNAEIGTIGMAPDVEAWFFPIVSVSHPGGRLLSAMISGQLYFERGDVLSYSIGFPPGPLVLSATHAILTQQATDLGITSVMSAGNSCFNLDEADYPAGNGGAIIVGAGAPYQLARLDLGFFVRYGFSNHHETPNTSPSGWQVMCQAWGGAVVTCGYGDLQFDNDRRRRYTADFGGTSAAAPMVAATVASLQGLSKMFFGIPLMPTQMRGIVTGTIYLQEGIPPGAQQFISGTFLPEDDPPGNPCNIFDLIGGPRMEPPPDIIGGQPAWEGLFPSLLTGAWFDPSFLQDLEVIKGERIYGNVNALKAAENNPLIMRSVFTDAGRYDGTTLVPPVTYTFAGDVTDIGVTAIIPGAQNVVSGAMTVRVAATGATTYLLGMEIFNHVTQRWDFLGVDGDVAATYHDQRMLPNPSVEFQRAHVNQQTGQMFLRVWLMKLGFGQEGGFITAFDEISISTTSGGFGGGIGLD